MPTTLLDLQIAEGRLDRAREETERARAGLLQSDGRPLYAPEEQARRLEAALRPLTDEVAATVSLAGTAEAEARATLAAPTPDPLATLDGSALQRAAALREFWREDAESLSLPALASRLLAALASGEQVQQVLALRYGQRRADQVLEDLRWRRVADPQTTAAELRALRQALGQLASATADPRDQRRRTEAEELARATSALRQRARHLQAVADGSDQRARDAQAALTASRW